MMEHKKTVTFTFKTPDMMEHTFEIPESLKDRLVYLVERESQKPECEGKFSGDNIKKSLFFEILDAISEHHDDFPPEQPKGYSSSSN